MLNSNVTNVKTYVGTDGKLHFVNSAGADTALNFSSNKPMTIGIFTQAGNKTSSGFYVPIDGYTKLTIYLNTQASNGGYYPSYDILVLRNGKTADADAIQTFTSNGYSTIDASTYLTSCTSGFVYFHGTISSSNYGRVIGTITLSN